jgi:hypothetical protein
MYSSCAYGFDGWLADGLTKSPNVLWKYFSFRWLVCGHCSGQYLVYDLPGAGPTASSNFLMAPDTSKPGAWRVSCVLICANN